MRTIKDFQEANQILAQFTEQRNLLGATYTLERMELLMDVLGHPEASLKIIHVAGTSGKTSTSYYISSLLTARYKKVGLTVSPHVAAINERVQINNVPLPEKIFCADLSKFLEIIEKSKIVPSYFEILVSFAYWEFAKNNVDYAVVEVGLGGLLDGTNVASRPDKICVITDIGFDHLRVLGNTLPEIATQKAGIIKTNNVVFTHNQSNEIMIVFRETCLVNHATLNVLDTEELPANIAFLPLFQKHNFALANRVVNYTLKRDGLSELSTKEIEKAAAILIPARMEIFKINGKTIVIDGAHNPQKVHRLIESLKFKFKHQSVASIVSFVGRDEHRLPGSLKEIAGVSSHIIITTFKGDQDSIKKSVNPEVITKELQKLSFSDYEIVTKPEEALKVLLGRTEDVLLCVGSFYLLNHIRPQLMEYV